MGGFVFRIAAPGTVSKTAKEEYLKMQHRLTVKGQVTIPKEIRELLGLEGGESSVEFAVGADGSVTLRKAESRTPRRAVRRAPQAANRRLGGGVLALLAGGI